MEMGVWCSLSLVFFLLLLPVVSWPPDVLYVVYFVLSLSATIDIQSHQSINPSTLHISHILQTSSAKGKRRNGRS